MTENESTYYRDFFQTYPCQKPNCWIGCKYARLCHRTILGKALYFVPAVVLVAAVAGLVVIQ